MASSGSSFIPQRPTRGKAAAKSFRKIYVLSYVSYLVFFSTLLAVGGVFAYKLSLEAELSNLKEALVSQKNLFNQSDLDRVRNLDYRIDTAKLLVNSHASVVTVLDALEQSVVAPVQLLSFNYNRLEDQRTPQLSLTAVAEEFDEVIFQEQVFSNIPLTSLFEVTNVALKTQPVNPERLELGVQQVVNLELTTTLSVSDINYTGFGSGDVISPIVPNQEFSPVISSDDEEAGEVSGESEENTVAEEGESTNIDNSPNPPFESFDPEADPNEIDTSNDGSQI